MEPLAPLVTAPSVSNGTAVQTLLAVEFERRFRPVQKEDDGCFLYSVPPSSWESNKGTTSLLAGSLEQVTSQYQVSCLIRVNETNIMNKKLQIVEGCLGNIGTLEFKLVRT